MHKKTYLIIGDIHGNIESLNRYKDLFPTFDYVIFVGDYMDRGSNSLACMKLAYELENGICLIGNHEWKYYIRFKKENINFIPQDVPKSKKMDFWELLFAIMYKHGSRKRYHRTDDILVTHAPAVLWQHNITDKQLKDKMIYGFKKKEKDENGYRIRRTLDEVYDGEVSQKPLVYGHIHFSKFVVRENEYCVDFDSGKGGPLAALAFEGSDLIKAYIDAQEVEINV